MDKYMINEKNVSFVKTILPKIRQRVTDAFNAAGDSLVGEVRYDYNGFEWLGFDFMLDQELNVKLIEVNSNPALTLSQNALMESVIPRFIDSCLKVAVDPFFGQGEGNCKDAKFSKVFEKKVRASASY